MRLGSSVSELLLREYDARKKKKPSLSRAAFARLLGLSASQLSKILSGQQGINPVQAQKVCEALKWNLLQKRHFLQLLEAQSQPGTRALIGADAFALPQTLTEIVSNWYYLAILQVMQTRGYAEEACRQGELPWLARSLNLNLETVARALVHLVQAGAIRRAGECHEPVSDFFLNPDGVQSAAIRAYHRQMIHKALDTLEFYPIERRCFNTSVLAIEAGDYPAMADEVREFQRYLLIKYGKTQKSDRPGNQVYGVSVQLYPLAGVSPGAKDEEGAANA